MLCSGSFEDGQWVRAMAALTESLGSVPSTHMIADNWLELQVQRIGFPLLAAAVMAQHMYAYIHEVKHTHKI